MYPSESDYQDRMTSAGILTGHVGQAQGSILGIKKLLIDMINRIDGPNPVSSPQDDSPRPSNLLSNLVGMNDDLSGIYSLLARLNELL